MTTIWDKLTEEHKRELAAATSRQILTTEELQEYKKKTSSSSLLVLVFIAVASLIYSGINGNIMIGFIISILFAIIILALMIRDKAKVSKKKILYKVKAYVLNRTYGSSARCFFAYYDFFKNDFTITNKTISTAAKGDGQLRPGNYFYIIAEQTSKKVKFVDYL